MLVAVAGMKLVVMGRRVILIENETRINFQLHFNLVLLIDFTSNVLLLAGSRSLVSQLTVFA